MRGKIGAFIIVSPAKTTAFALVFWSEKSATATPEQFVKGDLSGKCRAPAIMGTDIGALSTERTEAFAFGALWRSFTIFPPQILGRVSAQPSQCHHTSPPPPTTLAHCLHRITHPPPGPHHASRTHSARKTKNLAPAATLRSTGARQMGGKETGLLGPRTSSSASSLIFLSAT
jgi:hypothetical protein